MSLTDPAPETLDDARAQAAKTDAAAAADAPPAPAKRKRAPGKTRARKTPSPANDAAPTSPRPPRGVSLERRLEEFITAGGAMLLIVNARDGQAVIAGAPSQARALGALAKENPAVKRALEKLLTVSVYGQLLAAFAPTVLTIAANHGAVPPIVASLAGAALAPTPAPPAGADAPAGEGLDLASLGALAASLVGGGGDGAPFGAVVGMG